MKRLTFRLNVNDIDIDEVEGGKAAVSIGISDATRDWLSMAFMAASYADEDYPFVIFEATTDGFNADGVIVTLESGDEDDSSVERDDQGIDQSND